MQTSSISRTLKRAAAITVGALCVLVQQPLGARNSGPEQSANIQRQAGSSALTFSGFVRRDRRGVANVRLQLRNIDSGSIAGTTVSGPDGAFSFSIPGAAVYVVEAVGSDGKVKAVSQPARVDLLAVINDVILPSSRAIPWITTAVLVVSAAGAAGILVWDGGNSGGNVASPER